MSSEGAPPERPVPPQRPASPEPPGSPGPPALSSGPHRLHRAEIFLGALDNAREVLIAAVIGVVVGGGGVSPLFGLFLGLAGVGAAAGAGYVRWTTTTFAVRGGALHYRRGVLSPDETSVPLSRIQAIDATQGPLQRLFGVLELHVQTAGGRAKGEIVLRAVSEGCARELRAIAGLADPVSEELPEWRLGLGRLIVTALTAPQLGVILPLVGGFAAVGDDVLFRGGGGERLIDRAPHDVLGIALVVAAIGAAAFVLSFLGAIVTFAGFTLVRDGDRLRIQRGLLQRRAASLPVTRVHAVDLVEGVLRRPFGLASVRVETAGYRSEPAAAQTLLPLVRTREAQRLLAEFVPALATDVDALERPPERARRRYALPPALVGGLLGAGLTVALPPAWPAIPALFAVGAAEGLLRYGAAGWSEDGRRYVVRGRVLARRTLLARLDRLQEHGTSVSPLQRRAALADFEVAVGSGRKGRVRHLEATVAASLFERLRRSRPLSR